MEIAANDERPGIQETYSVGISASNLRVHTDRRNGADIVWAAGINKSALGGDLLRLKAEWDSSTKPVPMSPTRLQELTARLRREAVDGLVMYRWREQGKERFELVSPAIAAYRMAETWHAHELGLLFQRLKTLPSVREALVAWTRIKATSQWSVPREFPWHRWEQAEHAVASVLAWWLDNTCRTCNGVKWKVVPGTGRTNGRACEACKGTGNGFVPYGWLGIAILGFLSECQQAARSSMKDSMIC